MAIGPVLYGRRRAFPASLSDSRLADLAGVRWWLALRQRVYMLHTADDIAPCGVLIVEEARIIEADEKLAVRAVRAR